MPPKSPAPSPANHGRLTLPAEVGAEAATAELIRRLGADAVRNSDGTEVPAQFKQMGLSVYAKYFVNRGHATWDQDHRDQLQQLYLMSRPVTARGPTVTIDLLVGYFTEQVRIDTSHNPKTWWEVIDRTAGQIVPPANWTFIDGGDDGRGGQVVVESAQAWHEYTASFLVWNIWEPVSMYNHLTNDWGERPHEAAYDCFHEATRAQARADLRSFLVANPDANVIRFTTFFYQFTLIFNDVAKEKYVDWFGYSATLSPAALEAFAAEYGYRLRPEDFVDAGYYHSYFRPNTPQWRDWMSFVQRFVTTAAAELVEIVHAAGRQAMMFLGDQWIGAEPYGPNFSKIGLDAVVGSIGNGTTLRMIADIDSVAYTEGRLLPYFFPDTFHVGGDPAGQALDAWLLARRAMVRHPVDRIGYGGYPSLAAQFPDFVGVAEQVAREFRTLHDHRDGRDPQVLPRKVGLLNAWGKLRTWQTHQIAHALPYRQTEPYAGVLEALAGLPVEVAWLSFDDINQSGVPDDVGVLLNVGAAGTTFSGGAQWSNPKLVTTLRAWVDSGGAFIGVGQPSAHLAQGRTFQLADVLGVDQEIGFSLSTDHYPVYQSDHWVCNNLPDEFQIGRVGHDVFALDGGATVLRECDGDVHLAVNQYGQGRSAYVAGLPYNPANARLLHRLLLWCLRLDQPSVPNLPDNPNLEVAIWPSSGWCNVLNNTRQVQSGSFVTTAGQRISVNLPGAGQTWLRL